MAFVAICCGVILLLVVLSDTFETIVMPRTITGKVRLTRIFYFTMWRLSTGLACRNEQSRLRMRVLNVFGPLSLLMLLCLWAVCLIFALALIQWGLAQMLLPVTLRPTLLTELYVSASTFVTLGFDGVTARMPVGRTIGVGEAGLGLGFLAVVIGYLPVIYQSFSRREVGISLLGARAGSPPSGGELLRRYAEAGQMTTLCDFLAEWEHWASDVLESHLSYPVLAYYRSQHDRESWLAALTAILDTCTLIIAGLEGNELWQRRLKWQAKMTFAMARHATIDLALIFRTPPDPLEEDRLPPEKLQVLHKTLDGVGMSLGRDKAALAELDRLRSEYEPYVNAMARRLLLTLPPWLPETVLPDNWQTSAWTADEHFHA